MRHSACQSSFVFLTCSFGASWSRTMATDCSRRAFRSSNSTGRASSMRHAITRTSAHFHSPTPSHWRLRARSAVLCLPVMRACDGSQLPKRSLATASSGLSTRCSNINPQHRNSYTKVYSKSATTRGVDYRERRSTNVYRLSSEPAAAPEPCPGSGSRFEGGRCPSGPGSRASHRAPAKPGLGPCGLQLLSRVPRRPHAGSSVDWLRGCRRAAASASRPFSKFRRLVLSATEKCA